MKTTHLLYLHGFRSSPSSAKAQKMANIMASRYPGVTWHCPQLPPSPAQAMADVMAHIAGWPDDADFESMAVVGSSLGGFYATWVAQSMACKAVLLNPAIHPARDLAKYVGEQSSWQNPSDRFFFKPEFIDQLRALEAGPLNQSLPQPSNYLAIIAKGDEVLSWREMAARYSGANVKLLEGSDHALSDFDQHLPDILAFLNFSA
jgi:hypothetical protein